MTESSSDTLESALQALESQLCAIAEVALHGDPDDVMVAAARLRDAVEAWAQRVAGIKGLGAPDVALEQRLQVVSAAMQSTREGLLRRATQSGLALQAMLPPDSPITYSSTGGAAATRLRGRGGFAV